MITECTFTKWDACHIAQKKKILTSRHRLLDSHCENQCCAAFTPFNNTFALNWNAQANTRYCTLFLSAELVCSFCFPPCSLMQTSDTPVSLLAPTTRAAAVNLYWGSHSFLCIIPEVKDYFGPFQNKGCQVQRPCLGVTYLQFFRDTHRLVYICLAVWFLWCMCLMGFMQVMNVIWCIGIEEQDFMK